MAGAAGAPGLAVTLHDFLKHKRVLLLFASHVFPIRKQCTAIRGRLGCSAFRGSAYLLGNLGRVAAWAQLPERALFEFVWITFSRSEQLLEQ